MPSPRLASLQILTEAGLIPQQLQLEREKAARGAQNASVWSGALQHLLPQVADIGTGIAARNDAEQAKSIAELAATNAGNGGARDEANTHIGADESGPHADIAYTEDPVALAHRLAAQNPATKEGPAHDAAVAALVPQIVKQRQADKQSALDSLIKAQDFAGKGLDVAAKKVNVGQDVLKNVAVPDTNLGMDDLAAFNADPNSPDLQGPVLSRGDEFAKRARAAAAALGLSPEAVAALSGGELQSRDSAAERQAASEKEAARQRDIQSAAQREQERANRAREGLSYAELNQHAKDADAAAGMASNEDADLRAQAIAANREPPPSLRDKNYEAIMGKVRRINPAYDPSQWSAYSHTRSEQATDKGIQAGRAVVHHMDELRAIVDKMPSGSMTDTPLLNRGKQWVAGGLGSDDYTALQTAAHVVGDELSTALGVGDMSGRAQVMHLVRPEQTKEQWLASLGELEKLRNEKLGVAAKTLGDLGPQAAPQVSGKQALVDELLSQHATPEQIQAELTRRGF